MFSLLGCNKISRYDEVNSPPLTNSISSNISSKTAVLIAKGYLCFDYELKNYNVSVIERPEIWEVKFSKKKKGYEKYGPVIFINKTNGETVGGVHSK
jgi:hypothetical protein